MPRLFVGIRVSVATASALAGAAETLQRRAKDAGIDIRWVEPANYHVTLKFLGWTRDEMMPALRDGLAKVATGISRFSFKTARLGAFPSLEKANIVWAGIIEGADMLLELARRIEEEISSPLGFPSEKRPFHPHITLGRVRETRPVREAVLPLAEQMFGETRVDSISLFESETKSSGSVYTELQKISFRSTDATAERQTRAVEKTPPNEPDQTVTDTETDDGWPRGHNPDR